MADAITTPLEPIGSVLVRPGSIRCRIVQALGISATRVSLYIVGPLGEEHHIVVAGAIQAGWTGVVSYPSATVCEITIFSWPEWFEEPRLWTFMSNAFPLVTLVYEATFDSVGDATAADRMGWPVDDLVASLVFDWADGDSTAPDTGPSPLTKNGTVTAGQPTPWVDLAGNPVTCSEFLDNSNYHQATSIDPAAGHDVVGLVLCRRMDTATGAVFSTMANAAAAGISLSTNGTTMTLTVRNSVLATTTLTATIAIRAWHLFGFTVDADGNTKLYTCGVLADTDASPGGTLGAASGFSINAHNVSQDDLADVVRAMWWTGAGIAATATDAWHAKVAEAVLGIMPSTGTTGSTYARASAAVYTAEGMASLRCHIMGYHCPPAGNVVGLGADEGRTDKASRNYALVAADTAVTLGFTVGAGLAVSVVDDSAKLLDAGCRELGPYVVHIVSSHIAGALVLGDQTLVIGNPMGTTDVCWGSLRGRWISGFPPTMMWFDGVLPSSVIGSIGGGYSRGRCWSAPNSVNACLALTFPNPAFGNTSEYNIILWCAGVGQNPNEEIASQTAAGVDTVKAQGVLTTAHDPSNAAGTIDLEQTPMFWDGDAPTTAEELLRCGATEIMGLDGAGNYDLDDSTNVASVAVAEVDNTPRTVRAAWHLNLYAAELDGDDDTAPYDGAWPAGVLVLPGGPRSTQGLRVWDEAEEDTEVLP